MSYLEHQGTSGWMVLQDHDLSYPIGARWFRGVTRVVGTTAKKQRVIDVGATGDAQCWALWKPQGQQRDLPAWANVFPSMVTATLGSSGIGASGGAGDPNVALSPDDADQGGGGGGGGGGAPGAGAGDDGGVVPVGDPKAGGGLVKAHDDPGGRWIREGNFWTWVPNLPPGFGPDTSIDPFRPGDQSIYTRTRIGREFVTTRDVGWRALTDFRLKWSKPVLDKQAQEAFKRAKERRQKRLGQVQAWFWDGKESRSVEDDEGPRTVGILPIRREWHEIDRRYEVGAGFIPDYWPSFPAGTVGIRVGGTEDRAEHTVWMPCDPRLIAVNANPDALMGSLVCDLEPEGKIAIGSASRPPGVAGRCARLQSAWRVLRLPEDFGRALPKGPGNGIAWQLTASDQDGLAGYGLVYGLMVAKDEITERRDYQKPAKGQTTMTEGSTGPDWTPSQWSTPYTPEGRAAGFGPGTNADHAAVYGNAKALPRTSRTASQAGGLPVVGLMAEEAGGFGCFGTGKTDKHMMGPDKDGHPILPLHLPTTALWHGSKERDAPIEFSNIPYPEVVEWDIPTAVWLSYDPDSSHKLPTGKVYDGLWRLWTTTPLEDTPEPVAPPINPDPDPEKPPDDPIHPPPVITPRDPMDRGAVPGDVVGPRGLTRGLPIRRPIKPASEEPTDTAVSLRRNFAFASSIMRPQMFVTGAVDFRNSRRTTAEERREDDRARPAVLRIESWGRQTSGGRWTYAGEPWTTRVPWGTAAGGECAMIPEYDMMDAANDFTRVTGRTAYRVNTPSVWWGSGVPDLDTGDLEDDSWRWGYDTAALRFQEKQRGVWTDVAILETAGLDVHGVIKLNGTQILGSPVAPYGDISVSGDISGADTIDQSDLETRLSEIENAINQILADERTHGLRQT